MNMIEKQCSFALEYDDCRAFNYNIMDILFLEFSYRMNERVDFDKQILKF